MKTKDYIFNVLLILIIPFNVNSQNLGFAIGDVWIVQNTIKPVVNETSGIESMSESYNIYFDDIIRLKKFKFGLGVKIYEGWSHYSIEIPAESYKSAGGFGYTGLTRYGLKLRYNLFDKYSKNFLIHGLLSCELEVSDPLQNRLTGKNRSLNDEYYEGDFYYELIKRSQLVPTIGIDLEYKLFKFLVFKAEYVYTKGFVPYQKYYFDYSYKSQKQTGAEWHSNGTAHNLSIGLGFKIF